MKRHTALCHPGTDFAIGFRTGTAADGTLEGVSNQDRSASEEVETLQFSCPRLRVALGVSGFETPSDPCRVFTANDRGQAQFAADNGRVTRPPAAIRDNRAGVLHDGLPVGIGLVGDQDLAGPKLGQVIRAANDPHGAAADLLANTMPRHQERPTFFEAIVFYRVKRLLRLHGFRSGLHNE